jgi:hypothetical protein
MQSPAELEYSGRRGPLRGMLAPGTAFWLAKALVGVGRVVLSG